ncbi:hypothetical protein [Nostoc sp.]
MSTILPTKDEFSCGKIKLWKNKKIPDSCTDAINRVSTPNSCTDAINRVS